MTREYTNYKDRNGVKIYVGDTLKWIRDDEFYKSGAKKGQLKKAGAEFIAGKVVKLSKAAIKRDVTGGHEYWCQDGDKISKNDMFPVPPGLNFASMLKYIEVVS